ncbi:MAG: Phosphatidylinositol glycan, class [Parcubacteria group bacterium]|nr:Phosphatidylinositol glycan, class [Parcubacteria group bacterium]
MESKTGKILLVITKSNWGGAQAYAFALARHFRDRGIAVSVACGGTGAPGADTGLLAARLEEEHIPVHALASMQRDISLLNEWRAFRELCAVIRQERPATVHLNSSKAGIIGALAARACGIRHIVFTAHGWPHREPRSLLMRFIIWIASWLTVALSTSVIVVSHKDFETAPVFFSHRKLHVIHNGMDAFKLRLRDEARALLASHASDLSADAYWFLMTAELHSNKAIDTAIQAFEAHANTTADSVLVIMGEGQERAALEDQIAASAYEDRIHLLGFISEGREYLLAGDAFLLPSRKEGFPLVLLEAGIASLPVIASRTGGIPELIEDKITGLLVTPADAADLSAAMEDLYGNRSAAKLMGEALHAKVTAEFSETRMVDATLAAYR